MIQFIPVSSENELFLFRLFCTVKEPEVAAFGWDKSEREPFLHMQWNAQQHSYAARYPGAEHDLIVYEGEQTGRIFVWRQPDRILLVDISLLPAYRNRGIGTSVIRMLQEEAFTGCKTLRLSVFPGNPAIRLYERLGFRRSDEHDYPLAMVWSGGRSLSSR